MIVRSPDPADFTSPTLKISNLKGVLPKPFETLNFCAWYLAQMSEQLSQYSDTSANEWPCYRIFRLTKIFSLFFGLG